MARTAVNEKRNQGSLTNNHNNHNNHSEGRRTGFGLYVYRLMVDRGMTEQKELLEVLRGVGYDTVAQNLSNWLSGTRPPKEFLAALIQALELSAAEEVELYRKYVWEARS